jgi:hypothetical protein
MAAYKTYAWSCDGSIRPAAGVQHGPYVSPLDDQRIRREVDSRLHAKGYVLQDLSRADLVVSYGVRSEEKVTVRQDPGRSTYYTRGYGRGGWYSSSTVSVHQYTEGTMTIEFFDRETKNALWVGWGSKRLSKSNDRDELIREVVQKVLEPFPERM